MRIEIPDPTPSQFGEFVMKLTEWSNIPGAASHQMVAVQQIAEALARGRLAIVPVAPPEPAEGAQNAGS